MADLIPLSPGYYWAKWKIPADGTHEGPLLVPVGHLGNPYR